MNEGTPLIRAQSAVPSSATTSPPLTCEIPPASLVCILGQRINHLNAYMEMLAGIKASYSGSVDHCDSLFHHDNGNTCPTVAYLYHDSALVSVLNGLDNVKIPALYHQLSSVKGLDEEVKALLAELEYGAEHNQLPAFMSALQKRHLLIARSILLKPKALFIESPFKDLDREQVRFLGRYLARLVTNERMSVIVSNVNLDFVQHYADLIIFLSVSEIPVFKQWNQFSEFIKMTKS